MANPNKKKTFNKSDDRTRTQDFDRGTYDRATSDRDRRTDGGRGRGRNKDSSRGLNFKPKQDSEWYYKIPGLMEKAAQISFAYPLGDRLRIHNPTLNQSAIPGVMGLYITPTIGWCDGPTSPFNVATQKMYMALRSVWTARSQYDYPDLGMYLIALDSIFSFFAYAKRTYQFAWMTVYQNKYYPRALLRASGVDLASIDSELGNFSEWLTYYASQINQLYLPSELAYTQRHLALFSSIWTDDVPIKSQTYVAVPQGFWKFGWDDEGKGQLTWREILTTVDGFAGPKTFEGLKAIGEELLHNIISYEDFSIIGGDILKAYTPSECINATAVVTGEALHNFGPDVDWLSQIHNATMIGYLGNTEESTVITQRVNPEQEACLIHMPRFTYPNVETVNHYLNQNGPGSDAYATVDSPLLRPFSYFYDSRFLDLNVSDPTDKQIVEASRWMNIASEEPDVAFTNKAAFRNYLCERGVAYKTISSDVVNAAVIFYYGGSNDTVYDVELRASEAIASVVLLPCAPASSDTPVTQALDDVARALIIPSRLEKFDRHPLVSMAPVTATAASSIVGVPGSPYAATLFGDLCNYALVSQQELLTLNEAVMASLMHSKTTERRSPLSNR